MATELGQIEHQWARIVFQVTNSDEQDREMRALCDAAAKLVARYPGRAEPLIWDGIVTSSEAQYAGTFSALGHAKDARALFQQAGGIDYRAVDGAVPTSLGALCYLVPGFPFGFGDDSVARQYSRLGRPMASINRRRCCRKRSAETGEPSDAAAFAFTGRASRICRSASCR